MFCLALVVVLNEDKRADVSSYIKILGEKTMCIAQTHLYTKKIMCIIQSHLYAKKFISTDKCLGEA